MKRIIEFGGEKSLIEIKERELSSIMFNYSCVIETRNKKSSVLNETK